MLVLIGNQVANGTIYINMGAFLPVYVKHKFSGHITATMASIILNSFDFSYLVSSFIHKSTISKMGRKNALIISYSIMMITTALLGVLDYLNREHWLMYFILACLTRMVQGYGDSLAMTTGFSIMGSICNSDEIGPAYSYLQTAISLGTIIGPPFQSFFYGLFGFAISFYCLSLMFFFNLLQSYILVPDQLNNDEPIVDQSNYKGKEEDKSLQLDTKDAAGDINNGETKQS